MQTILRSSMLAVVASALLIGCGKEATTKPQELSVQVYADYPAKLKQMLIAAWPKVLQACPGLNSYASDLNFDGIDENLNWAPEDVQRVDVRFKVADEGKIPASFGASGHVCYFSISPDGKNLSISKSPCASICAGRRLENGAYATVL